MIYKKMLSIFYVKKTLIVNYYQIIFLIKKNNLFYFSFLKIKIINLCMLFRVFFNSFLISNQKNFIFY